MISAFALSHFVRVCLGARRQQQIQSSHRCLSVACRCQDSTFSLLAPQNHTALDVKGPAVRGNFIGYIIVVATEFDSAILGMGCVQHPPIDKFVDAAD